MITYKIKKTISGNCECINCRKQQPGLKPQPYTVWHKSEGEKFGHNEPACSLECCKEWIAKQK